jgi:hypothetical protein
VPLLGEKTPARSIDAYFRKVCTLDDIDSGLACYENGYFIGGSCEGGASQQQVAEIASGAGQPIAGAGTGTELRDAPRLAATYGGQPEDWAKVTSSNYQAADRSLFETHAYQNM